MAQAMARWPIAASAPRPRAREWFSDPQRQNPRPMKGGGFEGCNSLTMTYFHTGTRTIIGAESFHCPVRDGKEWYQLAMVIRRNLLLGSSSNYPANS